VSRFLNELTDRAESLRSQIEQLADDLRDVRLAIDAITEASRPKKREQPQTFRRSGLLDMTVTDRALTCLPDDGSRITIRAIKKRFAAAGGNPESASYAMTQLVRMGLAERIDVGVYRANNSTTTEAK
jgi:hypothetical protein